MRIGRFVMPIALPERKEVGLRVLEVLSDGAEHSCAEVRALVAARFGLSLESLSRVLTVDSQEFVYRVAFALVVLQTHGAVVKAGEEPTDRFRITPYGEHILRSRLAGVGRR